jgi:hypothetical protein
LKRTRNPSKSKSLKEEIKRGLSVGEIYFSQSKECATDF